MNRISSRWIISGLFLMSLGLSQSVRANALEETQLKTAQAQIDQHASVWSKDEHIDALAIHFKVPAKTVLELSSQNQGWGAVTIELAMANQYSTMHSQESAFITGSLERIEALRADGLAWGAIATKLKFELGPVIQEAKNSGEGLRQDDLALSQKIMEKEKVEENRRIVKEEHLIAQNNRADRR